MARYFHVSYITSDNGAPIYGDLSIIVNEVFMNKAWIVDHVKNRISTESVVILNFVEMKQYEYDMWELPLTTYDKTNL